MCGICGFNWEDKSLIRSMTDTLSHRGPDDEGSFTDADISLGHRRLSIIDLRKVGRNPMTNSEGTHQIVFNGEVYNFKELRSELEKKGYKFASNTDTEVVLNAYVEWGEKCLSKFNGMFALAIWDSGKKELFLARDRLGIKPLYYYHNPKGRKFIFASEIKAILHHEIPREVSIDGFNSFLSFRFTTGSQTILKDIFKLEPGSYLKIKGVDIEKKKYWTLMEKITSGDTNAKARELRKLLESSTRMRMISDVPIGAFLSGGLDSSLIVSLMAKNVEKPITTYSVAFEHGKDSELKYANALSEYVGTTHHEVWVGNKQLKMIPDMVWHLDEPIGDAATLPTMAISKQARKKLTVVLAGEGGDELFAGYDRYKVAAIARRIGWKGKPGSGLVSGAYNAILKTAGSFAGLDKGTNSARMLKMLSSHSDHDSFFNLICLFNDDEKKTLLGPINSMDAKGEPLKRHFIGFKAKYPLNRYLNFDINTVLCDDFFMKADKMTMAHSLEERVPLLDHRIAEFSMTLQPRFKLNKGIGKYILRRAVKDLVPKEILVRRKHGYDAPMNKWLKRDLYSQASELFEGAKHELYDTAKLSEMLNKFRKKEDSYKGSWYTSQKLWSMYMFELWHKLYIVGEHKKSLQI